MNKKLRKLLREPKQFFKDMYLKRSRKIGKLTPKKITGYRQYTVVSAVYNVGRYLDEYFKSLVAQRLDFRHNIRLIMVDDGSTDNSAAVIKRWQRLYPDNIVYLHQENGGQASARNFGINHVKTDWVTFIDPDDFVDLNYFLEVDNFLKKHQAKELSLLGCNFIFYHEDKMQLSDTHPMKYRFAKGDVLLPDSDLGKHLQMSVNSAFFKTEIIVLNSLQFDPGIRPNFEDAHYVGAYLAQLEGSYIGFANKAKYFYRKRSDGSSTLDNSWQKASLFDEVLRLGCLDLFERHIRRDGCVPKHIQRMVLYHVVWYLKRIINKQETVAFLDNKQRSNFLQLLDKLFFSIDANTILEFELAGCWFFHKVGILGAFKQFEIPFQIAYIDDYDPIKSQILIRYFTHSIGTEIFLVDGKDAIPAFAKTVHNDFLDRTFVLERRIWLPLPEHLDQAVLKIHIAHLEARLTLAGKQHSNGLKVAEILKHFTAQQSKNATAPRTPNAWLLMDRDTDADDNAEHLYRYIRHEYPEQPISFVLRRESHDWPRLARDGFNLLAFGSAEHEAALRSCKKIISSHADQYVVDYFKDKSLNCKQFIFLQHGVIHNDLSSWFNTKQRIDCFITTASQEYASIAGDNNRYKFTKKEVVMTGLPRHDALLKEGYPTERIILIMPTWRRELVGSVTFGNQRELKSDFMDTEYARAWNSLLHCTKMHEHAQRFGYRIVFFPHANIQPYLPQFDLPSGIEVLNHAGASIQELFQKAALMVTDYSSVAFDFSLLRKPVLYYQFDEATFFASAHPPQKGYFDYRNDGFGPVVTEEVGLLDALHHLLSQDAQPDSIHLDRMEAFFPFRDGRNCERVYQSIMALDAPMPRGYVDQDILLAYAGAASQAKMWDLAEGRWRRLLQTIEQDLQPEPPCHAQLELTLVLRNQGKLYEAQNILNNVNSANGVVASNTSFSNRVMTEQAELHMARYEWDPAITLWSQVGNSSAALSRKFLCLAEAGLPRALTDDIERYCTTEEPTFETHALSALAHRDWTQLFTSMKEYPDWLTANPSAHLLLVRAQIELGMSVQASAELVLYEQEWGKDHAWHVVNARFAVSEARWMDALEHFKNAYPEGAVAMPLTDGLAQIKAQRSMGNLTAAQRDLELVAERYPCRVEVTREQAELASLYKDWSEAAHLWNQLRGTSHDVPYRLATALRFMGDIKGGLDVLQSKDTPAPQLADEWQLLAELAQLQGDYRLAAQSWYALLRHHPENAPTFAWERLQSANIMEVLTKETRIQQLNCSVDKYENRVEKLVSQPNMSITERL